MRLSSRYVSIALGLVACAVYLGTLAPDMLPGDSGEFQFAAPGLQIVHPTGYPLYLLLGKLFSLLPVGSPAFRVNLLSAACAALAVALIFALGRAVIASWLPAERQAASRLTSDGIVTAAAGSAALLFAFSPLFWAQATEAEVYTLNALFVAALLLVAVHLSGDASGTPGNRRRAWVVLAALFGLSLAHHRTIILLLPSLVLLLFPFNGLRRAWPLAALAFAAPLLLYLYTPLRYDASPYIQLRLDDAHTIISLADTPQAFLAHMLGAGFSGALRWDTITIERLIATPQRMLAQLTWPGAALSIFGVTVLASRRKWRILAALLLAIAAYGAFDAAYHIGDISDFYTPVYLLGSVLVGTGAAFLVARLRSRAGAALIGIALFGMPAWSLAANFTGIGNGHPTGVRSGWTELMTSAIPAGAVLVSNDRDEMTPMYYLQNVDGLRPDLFGLFPLISTDPRMAHVVSVISYALETPHAVYLVKPMDGLSIKFQMQPEGKLVRVLGAQPAEPEHPLTREANGIRLTGWSSEITTAGQTLSVTLFWQATSTGRPDVTTYIHVVNAAGQTVAQSDHKPGGDYYPPAQWFAGDNVRDEHRVVLPASISASGLRLVAGAYVPGAPAFGELANIELGLLR